MHSSLDKYESNMATSAINKTFQLKFTANSMPDIFMPLGVLGMLAKYFPQLRRIFYDGVQMSICFLSCSFLCRTKAKPFS